MNASNRLCFLSAGVVALFGLLTNPADAAIRFTPSSVVFFPPSTSQQVNLDFDGDSLADFNVRNLRFDVCVCLPGDPPPPYWGIDLRGDIGATNEMHIVDAPGHTGFPPISLPANALIDGTKPYGDTDGDALLNVVLTTGEVRGNFQPSASPQYVGLKFNLAGNTRYGWIGFEVPPNIFNGVRLLGWAYEDTGASILAGQVPEPTTACLVMTALALTSLTARGARPRN